MSTFNPDAFINTEMKGAIDTTIIPVPQGEYPAQVSRPVKFREISTKDGDRTVADITWGIDDEGVKKVTGLDNPTCRQTVFLDLTEQGALDMSKGKNRQLGLVLEAFSMNDGKRPWAFAMFEGKSAKVKVEHSPNDKDPDNPYANVTRVTAL